MNTAPAPHKNNDPIRTYQDDGVPSLGMALAGISVGSGGIGNSTGTGMLDENGLGHSGEAMMGNSGLLRDGAGWGSAPSSGNARIGICSGFGGPFHGSNDYFKSGGGTPSGIISVDNSMPFSQPNSMIRSSRDVGVKPIKCTSGSAPTTPPGHKQSIDLFLSQSPSQSLGKDLFQLRRKSEIDSIVPPVQQDLLKTPPGFVPPSSGKHNDLLPPGYAAPQSQGQRDCSPSVSVVGNSSSRSVSPSHQRSNNGGHLTGVSGQQVQVHSVVAPSTYGHVIRDGTNHGGFSGQHNTSTNSVPSLEGNQHSQWANGHMPSQVSGGMTAVLYGGSKSPPSSLGVSMNQTSPFQLPQHHTGDQVQTQAQGQQVFYMAVPMQDGRQVLQPVQIVPAGSAQGLVALGGTHIQGQPGQPQPVVLMPAMQPGNPPADVNILKKEGSRVNKSYNSYGPNKHGGAVAGTHQGHNTDRLPSSYLYANAIPSQGIETQHRSQPKQYNSSVPQSFGKNDAYSGSLRGTPDNSQRSSPRDSPTPSDFITSLYTSPQRPPLDNLLGHVRRLSRDQVGCRLLQQALDEEGPLAATMILNEGLSFWGEAMVDPFGNYLFQKIAEKISADERVLLVRSVSARLVNASLNLHGTRSVQKVVELCAADEVALASGGCPPQETAAEILTLSLASAAARLCIDSHGNHVIQRILLKLPYHQSQFVFEAVAASVGDVARHRHGCCVIQRCLDSPPSAARSQLVHRIVEKALELMQDAYGNYVVQYVLDVCGDDDVHAVCENVVGKVNLLAIQKFSSNVMEKCLERCTDRVRELYLHELSQPERIRELMMDPFGNYVIQRALAVATHAQAVGLVEAMRPHLAPQAGSNGQGNGGMRNTAGGRRIMAKICRRFPNFNASNMGQQLYQQQKQNSRQGHRHQRQVLSSESPQAF